MTTASPDPTDDELGALIGRSLRLLKEEVPSWATQRALDAWRAPAPAAPGVLARLTALLRYDSWQHGTPAVALRSGGGAPRQLLYAVGAHDIDLRVQAEPGAAGRYEITGQVLGPATQGTAAWLADGAPRPPMPCLWTTWANSCSRRWPPGAAACGWSWTARRSNCRRSNSAAPPRRLKRDRRAGP
jgi:hypothetical protein